VAPAVPVTSLTALLCLTTFTNIVSSGAFPAVLPDIARSAALADWQIGIVAGAFGFARMVADIPLGLFLTRNLRRALWIGPLVLMTGGLCVTTGGGFAAIVFGRLLMGVGQALSMVAGLTAILRFQAGGNLASALAAYELSAMIGMLGGAALIGTLPSHLAWSTAFLLACAPQLIAVALAPKLLSALPAQPGAADSSGRIRTEPSVAPANPHRRPAGRRSLAPLVFAAGGLVALTYSTMEQFVVPLRGSREFGLERAGVARLFMVQQIFDIAALIPTGMLADRQGAAHPAADGGGERDDRLRPAARRRRRLRALRPVDVGLDAAADPLAARYRARAHRLAHGPLSRLRGRRDLPRPVPLGRSRHAPGRAPARALDDGAGDHRAAHAHASPKLGYHGSPWLTRD